jgi:hypothetical protein
MIKRLLLSFLLFSLLNAQSLSADVQEDLSGFETEEFGTEEDDLAGFEDEEDKVVVESQSTAASEQNFVLSGNVAFKTSAGYRSHSVDGVDYSGINQAQSSLYLQLDGRLSDAWRVRISGDTFYDAIYDIRSNDYRQEILDDYRTQLRLDDTYLQGRLTSKLDLKAGRQIVVWGKSDNIRITDVINPLDNRVPGMTDIEDLRLSVGMVKADYYSGAWNYSLMLIPENRIMHEATPRGEFFPVDEIFIGAPDPFLSLERPAFSLENMQYAFAANGIFSGWDLSFYAADVLDQKWHFDRVQGSVPIANIKRVVTKVKMLGSAVNIVSGSWLLKAEAAYLSGIRYNTTAREKERLDLLAGVEYRGIKDTLLSFEVANRHIFAHEAQMAAQADFVDKNEVQSALRLSRSFMNERLNLSGLVTMFGAEGEYGGFARIWAEYEIMDALSANVGIVDYIGGERPMMEAIKNNDRLFADIRYSF